MSEIRVVEATERDVAAIWELTRGLAEYEKMLDKFVVTEDGLRRTLFGDRPGAEVLLAFVSEECVGFALFFPNYSTFLGKPGLYLEDLFVKPHARRRGVGRALLRRLAEIATAREYGRMEWSVLDWNQLAIDFYEKKLGAVMMNEWRIFRLTEEGIARLAAT